jgi:hypothetical protein
MDPNSRIAAPYDQMNEMYEFFAFDEALENDLSVDALIKEQAEQSRTHIENRVNQLVSELNEQIEVDEREREELLNEAEGLAPREAQVYCEQLKQSLLNLKINVRKQEREFETAEKTTGELNQQNAILVASIEKMKALIQRGQKNQSHVQGQLYAAGTGLCQSIANSNQ